MIAVDGIFTSRADAERAAIPLREIGVTDEHLALLSPGTTDEEVEETVTRAETEHPGRGEKTSSAVGRGVGLAGGMMLGTAISSVALPAVGTVFAAGLLGAALLGVGGTAAGKAVGSAADEAITKASLHDEFHVYEEALRQGCTVLVAVAKDERQAGAAHERIADTGGFSSEATRESWWGRLRAAEQEAYAAGGRDFTTDEALYRRGFEAALHPHRRGRSFEEVEEVLRWRYGGDSQADAFRRGYERGQAHHQALMRKSRRSTE